MAKADRFYFNSFSQCASLCKSAANYLVECLESYDGDNIAQMLERMHVFEHSADIKKHYLTDTLARAFVTPVDREDIDMLSRQLDNVSDAIEEILQKFYVYNVRNIHPAAIEFAENLVSLCDLLVRIMEEFENFKKSKTISSLIISCNDMEEECDRLYLTTMRKITEGSADTLETVCWYSIFDCFESCADACEHVSECVSTIIMKNT